MSARPSQAIVLRQWDFSETSQTVALFTRDAGMLRGLAKGSRREKAPFSGGFEVLTRGEILFLTKAKSDLATLTEWDLQEVFWGARRHYRAHLASLYLADLVYHTVAEDDPHPSLFDRFGADLRALEDPASIDRTVLGAQWTLLDEIGSAPNTHPGGMGRVRSVGFDPEGGRFVEDPGPDGPLRIWRVRGETLALLETLRGTGRAPQDTPNERLRRASTLLAAFLAHTMGRDLPTRGAFFGGEPLPSTVQNGSTRRAGTR